MLICKSKYAQFTNFTFNENKNYNNNIINTRTFYSDDELKRKIDELSSSFPLHNNTKLEQSSNITTFQFNQAQSIISYYTLLLLKDINNNKLYNRTSASEQVAQFHFRLNWNKNHPTNRAQTIRDWGEHYYTHGELIASNRGKHIKYVSIIMEENIQILFKSVIRGMKSNIRTPVLFAKTYQDQLINVIREKIPSLINIIPNTISESTSRRWFKYLGFFPHKYKKNYYCDGHEREDVIKRRDAFIDEFLNKYYPKMSHYSGDNMTIITPPLLDRSKNEEEYVWFYQDESSFNSNDSVGVIWEVLYYLLFK